MGPLICASAVADAAAVRKIKAFRTRMDGFAPARGSTKLTGNGSATQTTGLEAQKGGREAMLPARPDFFIAPSVAPSARPARARNGISRFRANDCIQTA